jgi:hypothetical protein
MKIKLVRPRTPVALFRLRHVNAHYQCCVLFFFEQKSSKRNTDNVIT